MADMLKFSCQKKERKTCNLDTKMATLADCLKVHSERIPEREAVVFISVDGSRTSLTFRELYDNSVKAAISFIALGIRKSEHVALSLNSCADWLYAFFGAVLAGARPICLAVTYKDGSDVVAMLQKLETCSAIILNPGDDDENWKIVRSLLSEYKTDGEVTSQKMPYLRYIIFNRKPKDLPNCLLLSDMLTWKHTNIPLPVIGQDDVSSLFQTSGSSGSPKAVVHTHKSSILSAKTLVDAMGMGFDSIYFSERPFSWGAGFPSTLITGHTRVTVIGSGLSSGEYLDFLIDVIKTEKCTHMMALPSFLNSLMKRQKELGTPSPLQTILVVGQPIAKSFANCLGILCKVFGNVYGSTEASLMCCGKVTDANAYQEYSVGYPLEGVEIKIVNDKGEAVPVYERGEIYVKTGALFKEYCNDLEKTRAALSDDGWFRTDDIGYMSDQGTVYVTGRKSEVILSGGMNVTPTILEAVLVNCPGVARVVCVPLPHPVMFQVVCACVILEKGSETTEITLRSYCEDVHNDKPRLFTVVPSYYLFLTEIPVTYSGKVDRIKLTKIAADKFQSK